MSAVYSNKSDFSFVVRLEPINLREILNIDEEFFYGEQVVNEAAILFEPNNYYKLMLETGI